MTIDVRATVTCSLGTLISGSISDDYLQGSGLVKTRGSVELSGLLTPAVGTLVTFSYTRPSGTVNIPRQLRVLSSFADPYRRTTTVELGCLLTYFNNRKPPVSNPNSKEENDTIPCYVYNYATLPISASYVLEQCADALGLTLASNPLTSRFSREEFDLSAGYVQAMSDLLVSESYFGIVKSGTTLEVYSLQEPGGTGPVITDADVIDLGPIGVGELPGESVLVRYNTLRLKKPDPANQEESLLRRWESEVSYGPSQPTRVIYTDINGNSVQATGTFIPYRSSYSIYDTWDRLISSITYELNISSDISPRWNAGIKTQTPVERIQTQKPIYKVKAPAGPLDGFDLYEYLQDNGEQALAAYLAAQADADTDPASECIQAQKPDDYSDVLQSITETWISPLELAAGMNIDTFLADDGEPVFLSAAATIKESRIVVIYDKDPSTGITKTRTEKYQIEGNTIAGQQYLATTARDSIDYSTFNDLFQSVEGLLLIASQMKPVAIESLIRTEREYGLQRRPSQSDLNNSGNAKADATESVAEIEWIVGSPESQAVREFSVPFSPDDEIGWTLLGGYTTTPSDAKEKALAYGRVQNRLLIGNRNGLSLQLDPAKLPARPFLPVYLKAGGITAQYRANACSWAMSAEGVIASTDALFWGAVGADGGAGDAWLPLPPGMIVGDLPATPTITDGTMSPSVVVPPYSETVTREVVVRVGAEVQRFGYALELLTEVELATHPTVLASRPNDAGAYVVTGISALLQKAITIAADAGSLVVTGTDATLLRAGALAGDTGAYSITGIAADLRPSTVNITAEAGAFTVAGVSAATLANRQSSGEAGAFVITGNSAGLSLPATGLWLFPMDPLYLFEEYE